MGMKVTILATLMFAPPPILVMSMPLALTMLMAVRIASVTTSSTEMVLYALSIPAPFLLARLILPVPTMKTHLIVPVTLASTLEQIRRARMPATLMFATRPILAIQTLPAAT